MKQFSIFNFQFSISSGYTLIELLVSMGVIVVVGSILGSIIFSSLLGANKTNSVAVVRQNGNFAISQMAKMIRDAQSIEFPCIVPPSPTPTPVPPAISIVSQDGLQTVFSCSGTTIASNGASLIDTGAVSVVSNSCSFICTQISTTDTPTIGISFSLTRPSANVFEQQAIIPFQTTVTLRSLNR